MQVKRTTRTRIGSSRSPTLVKCPEFRVQDNRMFIKGFRWKELKTMLCYSHVMETDDLSKSHDF